MTMVFRLLHRRITSSFSLVKFLGVRLISDKLIPASGVRSCNLGQRRPGENLQLLKPDIAERVAELKRRCSHLTSFGRREETSSSQPPTDQKHPLGLVATISYAFGIRAEWANPGKRRFVILNGLWSCLPLTADPLPAKAKQLRRAPVGTCV